MNTTNHDTATLDPIELEVFKHLFASIAEEMGVRLMRSAYSPNIKERRDFSCAIFDPQGDMIAQAAHIPVHLGSAPLSVKAVLEKFDPATMRPGDRFIVNDPYAGGTHLPDITVVAPCFLTATPNAAAPPDFYVANRAHHADVGGITPGSLPISQHIDDEGVRIPPSRLTEDLITNICNQTRTPDERRGDLLAQCAALDVGITRLTSLTEHHTPERLAHCAAALQDYTARFVRNLIHKLPDGQYHFHDLLDDDGHGNNDIAIRCTLTIAADHATVDLRESDDQTLGPVNAVRAIALSATMYVFRCLAASDPGSDIPSNSGVLRPVTLLTRPGSIVDATYPAAVAGGNVETSQRIVDTLFGAIAQALPDIAPAASAGSMNNLTIGSTENMSDVASRMSNLTQTPPGPSNIPHPTSHIPHSHPPFAYYETLAGGAGAGPHAPGGHAIHTHMTNTLNTPVEALEHAYPFRVQAYAIRTGSGGAGKHAGGDGLIRRYTFDTPVQLTLLTERRRHAPYGLAGGEPAQPGRNILIHPNGKREPLPGKCTITCQPGDTLEIQTPGGGGWGTPRSI
ncbi:hydantoinase B/oxoprolinase family protein [Phycisphaerales bacterium AB-hyl4]|uniref:Hydantoinase B/oxoprolinase family protein n=1 Tax=Natronomicrosphaera hydrolytica TaxID=3242702 RepID=A0ABV4U7B4_9BACT